MVLSQDASKISGDKKGKQYEPHKSDISPIRLDAPNKLIIFHFGMGVKLPT